jgi:hypothetical protein
MRMEGVQKDGASEWIDRIKEQNFSEAACSGGSNMNSQESYMANESPEIVHISQEELIEDHDHLGRQAYERP